MRFERATKTPRYVKMRLFYLLPPNQEDVLLLVLEIPSDTFLSKTSALRLIASPVFTLASSKFF